MTTISLAIILCTALVFSILFGTIRNINIGLLGMLAAFFIGCGLLNLNPTVILSLFPVKLLFITMSTTFFFGFAIENGTISSVADQIIYRFRQIPWSIPLILAMLSITLGMMGADTISIVSILAPIGFVLCEKLAFHPLLVIVGVGGFAAVGSSMSWSSIGSMCIGILSQTFSAYTARMENAAAICSGIIYTIVFIILYVILKGYRACKIEMQKPKTLNLTQKKTLVILCIALTIIIVPMIIHGLNPSPFTAWVIARFDIQFVTLSGAVVCSFLKLADERAVVTKRIPWSLIIMVCGISMLIGLAEKTGVMRLISKGLSEHISETTIQPLILAIGSLFSFVANGVSSVLIPFTPMLPHFSEVTGLSTTTLFACLGTSITLTCLSPFSMGGSFVLSFAPQASQKKLMIQQIVLSILTSLLGIGLSFTGLYHIFS